MELDALEMKPPVRVEREDADSVPVIVVLPAARVSAPISMAPNPEVMEPTERAPALVTVKTSVPTEFSKFRKFPPKDAVLDALMMLPVVEVATNDSRELNPVKSVVPSNRESVASLGRR